MVEYERMKTGLSATRKLTLTGGNPQVYDIRETLGWVEETL